jgi:hypothetical protein
MKKFVYWFAECVNDSSSYSIRAKTKKGLMEQLSAITDWGDHFGPPQRHEIEYEDIMDLVSICLGEGRAYENGGGYTANEMTNSANVAIAMDKAQGE